MHHLQQQQQQQRAATAEKPDIMSAFLTGNVQN
jgi:hypothetical protein